MRYFKNYLNFNNFKKFSFFAYIAILFIIFLDPQKRIWWSYNVEYKFELLCYDLPRCLRIFDFNIRNVTAFFFDLIFVKSLNFKINNAYIIPHYFLAVIALSYVFYVIKSKISSTTIFLFFVSYIMVSVRIYNIPAFFLYDYFALGYIFLIISYFSFLKKNFFSAQSILLLFIGTLIYEYLGFLYYGTIISYNFLTYQFKKIYFQLKHLFLGFVPLITIILIYTIITSNPSFYWGGATSEAKSALVLWNDFGQNNNLLNILSSLFKYSFLLIMVFLVYLFQTIIKKKSSSLIKNNNIKLILSLMINFLIVVVAGSFTSSFYSEWQRQFLPFLFLSSILSFYIINEIKLFKR